MAHFRHRYPPVHIERKRAVQLQNQKLAPQTLDLTNFLIKLIRLGRKYCFTFTCRRRGVFVGSVAVYWGFKYWTEIAFVPCLFLYCYSAVTTSTGDTPTVNAAGGFRLAGRVSTDA